jgi:hypothetical protein
MQMTMMMSIGGSGQGECVNECAVKEVPDAYDVRSFTRSSTEDLLL